MCGLKHKLRRWWWGQSILSDTIAAFGQYQFDDEGTVAISAVWLSAFVAIDNNYMDVNACLKTSKATLLHVACCNGHANAACQLLQRGANPSAVFGDLAMRPMRIVLLSNKIRGRDRVRLCSMLPLSDLAYGMNKSAPLCEFFDTACRSGPDEATLQWLLQQRAVSSTLTTPHYACGRSAVQCCRENALILARTHDERCAWDRMAAMVEAEIAAQKRWKPARAAWCAAVLRLR